MIREDCLYFRSGMKIVIIALITGIAAVSGVAVIGFLQVVMAWNDFQIEKVGFKKND
jgi:cell division septal protein FtsQ